MENERSNTHKRPRSPSLSIAPRDQQEYGLKSDQDEENRRNRLMDERERHEIERKKRMARLRAENEAEEKKLAKVDEASKVRAEGGEYENEVSSSIGSKRKALGKEKVIQVDREEIEELDEEDQMMKLFGFDGFESTKGKSVEDNQTSASKGLAAKNKARKYRQYMNRKGGFNRPLDKMN